MFCDPEPVRQNGSRAQAGPGEELESEELSNVPLAALNFLFPSCLLKSYQIWDVFLFRQSGMKGYAAAALTGLALNAVRLRAGNLKDCRPKPMLAAGSSAGRRARSPNEKDAQRCKISEEK